MHFRKPLLQFGRRWPLLLLLGSIVATIAATSEAYKTIRAQRDGIRVVMAGYSEFAAWSFQQHVEQSMLNAAGEILGPVNHGDALHSIPEFPHAQHLVQYLSWDQNCVCRRTLRGPPPHAFFGYTLGSDTVGIGLNRTSTPDAGWLGDRRDAPGMGIAAAEAAEEYGWVNDTVTALARSGFKPRNGYVWVASRRPEGPSYLAYRLMPMLTGDTVVYGAQYDSTAFAALLDHVLDEQELLPAAFSRHGSNRELISVEVTDGMKPVYRSRENIPWLFEATHRLDDESGGLIVRAQIRPNKASALLIGGAPRSRLPFLVVLIVLAAALSLVAFAQIARESDLARTRESFVSSVSHELRTPVAQIRLYLDTLRLGRAENPADRDRFLANIDRETQRLSNLVDNVLRFSRPGASIVAAAPAKLDIGREAEAVVDEFRPLAASKRATIEVDAEKGAHALISPDALRHILLNLLDNAVKFGPEGQLVRVHVTNNGKVRVAVSDQGGGIPQKERAGIWEAFSRGRNSAARSVGGSGIGLTVVRDLVTRNSGTIRVEDAPGGGAAFVIELPAA